MNYILEEDPVSFLGLSYSLNLFKVNIWYCKSMW